MALNKTGAGQKQAAALLSDANRSYRSAEQDTQQLMKCPVSKRYPHVGQDVARPSSKGGAGIARGRLIVAPVQVVRPRRCRGDRRALLPKDDQAARWRPSPLRAPADRCDGRVRGRLRKLADHRPCHYSCGWRSPVNAEPARERRLSAVRQGSALGNLSATGPDCRLGKVQLFPKPWSGARSILGGAISLVASVECNGRGIGSFGPTPGDEGQQPAAHDHGDPHQHRRDRDDFRRARTSSRRPVPWCGAHQEKDSALKPATAMNNILK